VKRRPVRTKSRDCRYAFEFPETAYRGHPNAPAALAPPSACAPLAAAPRTAAEYCAGIAVSRVHLPEMAAVGGGAVWASVAADAEFIAAGGSAADLADLPLSPRVRIDRDAFQRLNGTPYGIGASGLIRHRKY
jgi:hypothetical protein